MLNTMIVLVRAVFKVSLLHSWKSLHKIYTFTGQTRFVWNYSKKKQDFHKNKDPQTPSKLNVSVKEERLWKESLSLLIVIQESVHVLTGGTKFYLEPVDSTAVDERRKHSHSASERITDGTHSQYHVQICANTLNEEVVHRQRSSVDFTALRKKNWTSYRRL